MLIFISVYVLVYWSRSNPTPLLLIAFQPRVDQNANASKDKENSQRKCTKNIAKRLVDKYYCLEFDLRHANDGTRPCAGHWLWDWSQVCLEIELCQLCEYSLSTIALLANCCQISKRYFSATSQSKFSAKLPSVLGLWHSKREAMIKVAAFDFFSPTMSWAFVMRGAAC